MADLHRTLVKFDIDHDKPVTLSPLVRRITARNSGPYTGPGTNTYLVGSQQLAVIDPGPAEASHIDAILRATEGKIDWIIATHTHMDHSPAGKALADASGALMVGQTHGDSGLYLDDSFQPDLEAVDGMRVITPEFSLRAIATPGHVSNHVCFLLEQERMLFAGDHIMQGASVVIVPQHGGDMGDYMASLLKLKNRGIQHIAPAHGHLLGAPDQVITELYDHRLQRERRILEVLGELKQATLKELAVAVYPEMNKILEQGIYVVLRSHLEKLVREGLATHATAGHHGQNAAAEDTWEIRD